jgi:endonuclease YncB( thermonuclease family)
MPRGLIFRLLVMLIAAIAAFFYFRRAESTMLIIPNDSRPAIVREERSASAARLGPCDVTHVTDGDTLNVRCGARKERVRMLQIDTPERDDALYAEAGDALEALIAGRAVELELGAEERDDHGRLLAYVFAGDENLNLAMIEAGWSPYFDRYGAGAYPREFADAERTAREAKRGIWGGAD